jgi:four helix bundle protein
MLRQMATTPADSALLAWENVQPASLTGDAIWRLDCYRESLYLLHIARADITRSVDVPASQTTSDQLLSALASIGANIAEGYGRATNADRARFFAYALGSAREAVVWYQAVVAPADGELLKERLERLARVKRMLLGLLGRIRARTNKPFEGW